jgi:hypothetical protein
MLKKLLSLCVLTASLIGLGAGCRTSAHVKTAHHSAGVGVGAH